MARPANNRTRPMSSIPRSRSRPAKLWRASLCLVRSIREHSTFLPSVWAAKPCAHRRYLAVPIPCQDESSQVKQSAEGDNLLPGLFSLCCRRWRPWPTAFGKRLSHSLHGKDLLCHQKLSLTGKDSCHEAFSNPSPRSLASSSHRAHACHGGNDTLQGNRARGNQL